MEQIPTTPDIQIKPMPAAANERKNPLNHIVVLFCLALAMLATTPDNGCAAPAQKTAAPPLVTVATVTEHNVSPVTEYVGHIEAIQTVDLQARVSGFLEQIHFKEGSDAAIPRGKHSTGIF